TPLKTRAVENPAFCVYISKHSPARLNHNILHSFSLSFSSLYRDLVILASYGETSCLVHSDTVRTDNLLPERECYNSCHCEWQFFHASGAKRGSSCLSVTCLQQGSCSAPSVLFSNPVHWAHWSSACWACISFCLPSNSSRRSLCTGSSVCISPFNPSLF